MGKYVAKDLSANEIAELVAITKQMWHAETPDGKEIYWIPNGNACLGGDVEIVTKIESLVENTPLNLSYNQKLPATTSNPYSVKLALEMLYNGKEAIKYSGNVPDLKDVKVKISPTATE